jgi:hypothetical protein
MRSSYHRGKSYLHTDNIPYYIQNFEYGTFTELLDFHVKRTGVRERIYIVNIKMQVCCKLSISSAVF